MILTSLQLHELYVVILEQDVKQNSKFQVAYSLLRYICRCMYMQLVQSLIQWNPSKAATIETREFDHYRWVAGHLRGRFVLFGVVWDLRMWPLCRGWPDSRKRGFLSTILNGDAVGTKVNGRYRQGGRLSGVAVKRSSTVLDIVR